MSSKTEMQTVRAAKGLQAKPLQQALLWLLAFCLQFFCLPSSAQINPANLTPEQLKTLIMAQPKIDVESPVNPMVAFDPPMVRPGEMATYRVTLNALEASIEWPESISSPELTLEPRGRGQILPLSATQNKYEPRTTFNYRVRAGSPGSYLVPEFTVTVYGQRIKIPAARLDVTPTIPAGIPAPQYLKLKVPPATNLYVGEAIKVQVMLPGTTTGVVQGVAQIQLNGKGFLLDQSSAQQRIERINDGSGNSVVAYVYEASITPIAAGNISLIAQGYSAGSRFTGNIVITGPAVIPGGVPQYTLLDSEPVEIRVQALPETGRLPGFAGAVGSFMTDTPVLSTNDVRLGEPVKLMVKVHGDGNLARLVAPKPPRNRDWQMFPATTDNLPPQLVQAQGFTTLTYTLIPLSDELQATPAIPFSCFDPRLGRYVDLTVRSVPIAVRPGPIPGQVVNRPAEVPDPSAEPELALAGLASAPGLSARSLVPLQQQHWFPLVQLAPAFFFAVLWQWERRRRYFETHPEELLRRRARRALRRERRGLKSAAQSGDAAKYLQRAIAALRIAAAPHYPAEPRALVGADILALLEESDRVGSAGRVATEFFSSYDAQAFSSAATPITGLLSKTTEFDRLLDLLESKLRPSSERDRLRALPRLILLLGALGLTNPRASAGAEPASVFQAGTNAYAAGAYSAAARAFEQAATQLPSSGALQNLGNAEWLRGRSGFAVLAWERAMWLDPFNQAARSNLRYARKLAQLEGPELSWYEVVSTWLPVNWWAALAGLSFWGAVAMVMVPGIMRWRKSAWHQALAALALALFLLSLPAHFGVATRSRIGFVLQRGTPLRLTPTEEAQPITWLAAGEPARVQRVRGQYCLVATSRTTGWLHRDEFALICPPH
jgi:tetratricopeptide (TPR) repeat protein